MLQRALERLPHLDRIGSIFIIGFSMILSVSKGKFRLNKELFSFLDSSLQEPLNGSAHAFFIIMFSLIRCVDPGEPHLQSLIGQPFRFFRFPGRAVKKGWYMDFIHRASSYAPTP